MTDPSLSSPIDPGGREGSVASPGDLKVLIATPLGPNGKGGMDRLADLTVAHMQAHPEFGIEARHLTTKGGLSKLRGAFVFSGAIAKLLAAGAGRRTDLVHINLAAYGSVYRKAILAEIAHRLGIPYVVHVHSGRFGDFWKAAPPSVSAIVDRMFRNSAQIIVLGRGYADLVRERLPEVMAKTTVLPNATKARLSEPRKADPTRPKQITYLGLVAPKKGVPELVAALEKLRDRSDWHATIAGHGMVDETQQDAAARGLGDKVELTGWIGTEDVDALLARTDIFVLPSYSEGLSMAVLEAFAWSTAVVTTPVNAMTEVVEHGRNGLFVTPGNVDELADALRQLLDDDELRTRLGTAAHADHAARYENDQYMRRLAEIWRTAVRKV